MVAEIKQQLSEEWDAEAGLGLRDTLHGGGSAEGEGAQASRS